MTNPELSADPRAAPELLEDGLTPQEYALRHHLPLELVVERAALNREDRVADYPPPSAYPGERARAVLRGLTWAGLIREEGAFILVPGEVRRLELLRWDLSALRDYGFRFRQDYTYAGDAHRLVAHNRLKVPKVHLERFRALRIVPEPPPDFLLSLAVYVAHAAELHGGYLFLLFPDATVGRWAATELLRHRVLFKELDAADQSGGALLRTLTPADAQRLLDLLRERLREMPGALDRFEQATPEVTVCKELVFDAAHFITDHPAKCSNLHGGRYALHVKVSGRVDPVTGCVVDYGYLKRVVTRLVIERFDHHTLNYTAPELAWRSSTEVLCVYIWEQLIDYLPGLTGLDLYETPQSWCSYRGPSLEEFQRRGSDPILSWWREPAGGSGADSGELGSE
ncbi:MAG TPA: 6-carboxytetrahydropterin synthase, partial [Lamprocystis sp. (in: g-proteobacteria)]|nr:6-carboxytetrahydropterin synthase [Lamprocystis sp. (in: g-proteobacteria)]